MKGPCHILPAVVALTSFLLLTQAPAQRTETELRKAVMDFIQQGTFLPTGADKVLGDDYEAGLPVVLEILAKPESYGDDNSDVLQMVSCPAVRAFDMLREKDYPKALSPVAAMVDSPSSLRRCVAAMLLVKIPGPDTVEPLRKLLSDPHALPAAVAADQIDDLFAAGHEDGEDPKWAHPLFDALAKVPTGPAGPGATPVWALLLIDREKGIPLVTSPAILNKKNPKVHQLLWSLNQLAVPVADKELLKTLYKESTTGKTREPEHATVLLHSLALAKVPEAAKLLETALARPRPSKQDAVYAWMEEQEAATAGFLAFHGFTTHPVYYLRRQINKDPVKMAALNPNARTAVRAAWLSAHIFDYGDPAESLANFLESAPPAEYAPIVEALRTIKAPKAAQILADTLKVLGSTPLPPDREARAEALYSLDDRTKAVLKKAPTALAKAEPLDLIVLQWILKHRSDFPNPTPEELAAEKAAMLAEEEDDD